uniref:NADH:ubiquinone reductase (H(+)-translocating) n=1 Tax=Southwellina hispida TaxID=449650 RepID=A0A0C4MWS5_9BILA|nr:NADH dehydrogenase subunit 5 [Southwellina hispida]AIO11162.1 NADH dehydrogenase subunit 5 [Southwellina hispida]
MMSVGWSLVGVGGFILISLIFGGIMMWMSSFLVGGGWFELGGESTSWGMEVGGGGFGMVMVLLMVYSMVSIFSYYYVSASEGVGVFNWMVFVFVVGVVVLLMAGSLYMLLVGWEILGVVSFILIGFYCNRVSWGSAIITMLINRLGDVALVLMFLGLIYVGYEMQGGWCSYMLVIGVLVVFCLLTKSAEFPFGGWLPLAMAAPTPVSALVHSSTLVIAGLYVAWVLEDGLSSIWGEVLGVLGVVTLVGAAISAVFEMDFKKVVAYSTSMHLGLMLCMAVWVSWVYMGLHMELHAFFKSLLFIGVGLVIMMIMHDQDFRGFMTGGLVGSVVGVLVMSSLWSLVGLTYFSGWLTKDGLLEMVMMKSVWVVVWIMVMVGLAGSGVYSLKLVYIMMMSSVVKISLMVSWEGVVKWGFGVLFLGCIMSVSFGVYVGLWEDWGFGVVNVDFFEKVMFIMMLVVLGLLWVSGVMFFVGSGVSVYMQIMYQYLLGSVFYYLVREVVRVEEMWLSGLIKSIVVFMASLGGLVVSLLVQLDWYFMVGVVVLGVCLGVYV